MIGIRVQKIGPPRFSEGDAHFGKFFVSCIAEAEGRSVISPSFYYHAKDDLWRQRTHNENGEYTGFYDTEKEALAARDKAGGN